MDKQEQSAEQIFGAAIELGPEERTAYLAHACRDSPVLRHLVDSLLAAHADMGGFLEVPPVGHAPTTEMAALPRLTQGSRLGRYTIAEPLGSGAMGAVYQAWDGRLERTVAIKILAPGVLHGYEARVRFRREALALAKLSQAHIAAVFDVGEQDGIDYLVMECVRGETLAHKLAAGPVSIPEAASILRQIAEALEEAHEQGVVHRDLKPANVMLTVKGQVKVLDFGIAKLLAEQNGGQDKGPAATETGMIVGTPRYMSPEQALGKTVDARTDLWSLGVIFYKLLTGEEPFHADNAMAMLHAILYDAVEPVTKLRPDAPPICEQVVTRLLTKDRDQRYATAADVVRDASAMLRLVEPSASGGLPLSNSGEAEPPAPAFPDRRAFLWGTVAALVAGGGVWCGRSLSGKTRQSPVNLVIPLPTGAAAADPGRVLGPPIVAPDGSAVVVSLNTATGEYLFIRHLETNRLVRIEGTQDAVQPFWSPDSQHIAFFAEAKLKRIPVIGGNAIVLCDAPEPRGGCWGRKGVILFGINFKAIFRVSESGGEAIGVTELDKGAAENSHRNPVFLPDGDRFLFYARADDINRRAVFLSSLDKPLERRRIVVADQQFALGRDPVTETYYLLSQQSGKITFQAFNVDRGELTGTSAILLDRSGTLSVSETGVLVIRTDQQTVTRLLWFDREGKQEGSLGTPDDYWRVTLSPDGRFAGATRHDYLTGQFRIWIVTLASGLLEPLNDLTHAGNPIWPGDGKTLYYVDLRKRQLLRRPSSSVGNQPDEVVFELPKDGLFAVEDISSDQRFVVAEGGPDDSHSAVLWTELAAAKAGAAAQWHSIGASGPKGLLPSFSPDGRWLAFASAQTGNLEVYVMAFPPVNSERHRISVFGGHTPRWRHDGKELFFLSGEGGMMSMEFPAPGQIPATPPKQLFQAFPRLGTNEAVYDVSPDGKRFLIIDGQNRAGDSEIEMILNWPSLVLH